MNNSVRSLDTKAACESVNLGKIMDRKIEYSAVLTQAMGKFGIQGHRNRWQMQETKKKAGENPNSTIISAIPSKGETEKSHIRIAVILSCVI